MRFCDRHWDATRDAVAAVGLEPLVSRGADTAAARFARVLAGEDTLATFDPLMFATWAIIRNACELVEGAEPLTSDGCPVCFVNDLHAKVCPGGTCVLDRERAYDGWPAMAARDAAARFAVLRSREGIPS